MAIFSRSQKMFDLPPKLQQTLIRRGFACNVKRYRPPSKFAGRGSYSPNSAEKPPSARALSCVARPAPVCRKSPTNHCSRSVTLLNMPDRSCRRKLDRWAGRVAPTQNLDCCQAGDRPRLDCAAVLHHRPRAHRLILAILSGKNRTVETAAPTTRLIRTWLLRK
jgi:hypothetical protein